MSADALRAAVRRLYTGHDTTAVRFRYALIVFDVSTIAFFIATMPFRPMPAIVAVDTVLGVLILADFAARLLISDDRARMLTRIYAVADVVVIASLLLMPFVASDLAFLRILRGLRLIHSYHLLRDLRRDSTFFRRHEDALIALVNLLVFVLVTSSVVFVLFSGPDAGPEAYVDAIYFTVATLTTTGFGDITPTTTLGKLLSVFIMVAGVALFVQLARAVFQPAKIRYRCPVCALSRHDKDAIHCKHCGEVLRIETEGAG